MSKENGFLQLRRGVFEHVRDGRMSLADCAVHSYITAQADTRTGIWNGSAGALAGELSLSRRKARRFLEKLSRRGYIKRFPVPGKHVCYPILIHKFSITDGQHRGEQLNAIASSSPVNLEYCTGQQEGEQRGQHKGEHVSPQKILETREGRQERKSKTKPAAKTTQPPDPRFQGFFSFAYEDYRVRKGQPPAWGGKHKANLKQFLQENPAVGVEEWQRRWLNYSQSTEAYTVNQGRSLAHFCSKFDSFFDGPVVERRLSKGGIGHAASIDARNLAAAGFRN